MNKYKIIISIFLFTFAITTFASTSNGTVDSTYHYAYGENIGFVDFSNTTITDTSLSGYAYGENIGWINLSTITNNEGTLGGYAWGENVGFVDFSKVTIDNNGVFTGNAYGENIGWITFSPTDNNSKVVTDWRKPSSRIVPSHSSSGGYLPGYGPRVVVTPVVVNPLITETPKITKTLKQGLKNDTDVKTIQTYLNTKLNLTLIRDGSFGRLTKLAVIKFQKLNKLKPDGIVGPITRALLIK